MESWTHSLWWNIEFKVEDFTVTLSTDIIADTLWWWHIVCSKILKRAEPATENQEIKYQSAKFLYLLNKILSRAYIPLCTGLKGPMMLPGSAVAEDIAQA